MSSKTPSPNVPSTAEDSISAVSQGPSTEVASTPQPTTVVPMPTPTVVPVTPPAPSTAAPQAPAVPLGTAMHSPNTTAVDINRATSDLERDSRNAIERGIMAAMAELGRAGHLAEDEIKKLAEKAWAEIKKI